MRHQYYLPIKDFYCDLLATVRYIVIMISHQSISYMSDKIVHISPSQVRHRKYLFLGTILVSKSLQTLLSSEEIQYIVDDVRKRAQEQGGLFFLQHYQHQDITYPIFVIDLSTSLDGSVEQGIKICSIGEY